MSQPCIPSSESSLEPRELCCGAGHDHAKHEHADHDHKHDHAKLHTGPCCAGAHREAAPIKHEPPPEGARRARFRIEAMDCPTEEQLIRKRLARMPGIARLDFNLLDRELTVYHHLDDAQPIALALAQLDMDPVALEAGEKTDALPGLTLRQKGLLATSGLTAIGAEIIAWKTGQEASWPVMALAGTSILAAGVPTLKKGWIALKNLTINIYYLMSLAVIGALVIGKWPEAAMVIFLFAIAETIETMSLVRARNAIKSLTALAPETAEVKEAGVWQERPVGEVEVGSIIRVRTGTRVPLDARVLSGQAALNQAPITGESLPVDKAPGDLLYAGSIVTDGAAEAAVTSPAGSSTLARIAAAIQEAQSERAPMQRFVDQFAHYYTPAVVLLAIVVAIAGPMLSGGPWGGWLYQAIVLLVIACPCALVVSTPVTVVSGLAAAAKHGILIKGGAFLENGRKLKAIALDKTGTLTQGKPVLTEVIPLGEMSLDQALRIAASLDEHSTHPIAQALVKGWQERATGEAMLPLEDFGVLNGRGVKGRIDGQPWHLGNHQLVEELNCCSPELETHLAALEGTGRTVIILCAASGPVALFTIADTVRPESQIAVKALRAIQVEPVMLTGDNPTTAKTIATQLGIEDARGNLLPEDKQAAVAELHDRYGVVGMVGDGVNDAPALARADIGIAMGAAGTATAMETADVAIMDDDPRKIADFIGLSKRTGVVLKQNISLALGIKLAFLLLAISGRATLWMAVFADMGASLLVVFNGLRLLRHFPQNSNQPGQGPH